MKLISFLKFILEAKEKTIVFSFGRFNPPSNGHGKLIDKVKDVAKKNKGEARIYISNSQDKKKNPIPPKEKQKIMKKLFPGTNIIQDAKVRNAFEVIEFELRGKVGNAILVVGSDRVPEFTKNLIPWGEKNGVDVKIVSAGERDPDAEGVTGISGSKMREFVKNDDFESFVKGLPKTDNKTAKKVFNLVKKNQ